MSTCDSDGPQDLVPASGGEAIACAGLNSVIGSFDLGANCGSGVTVSASLSQTGTSVFNVPEPGTLALAGAGRVGLGIAARRRRR